MKFTFDITRQLPLTIIMLLLSLLVLSAQEKSSQTDEKYWGIPKNPFNCETNYSYLQLVRESKKAQRDQNTVLIIIGRRGDGEYRNDLNRRRLHNVRLKLNNEFGIELEKIIVAEGEPTKGFGRIEFYLYGEMIGALLVPKNGDICVGCCDPDERFYPYKEQFERKQKRKNRSY